MEHEVFVPVPAERLRDVLADPARVAGAVPGLQQEAGAEPVTGRLKVRVGSHSVTYRGRVRVSAREDGAYVVAGDAGEARGSGAVSLALTLRVVDAEGGCTLVITGTAKADGRVTELPPDAVTASVTRLLTRFAENLGKAAEQGSGPAVPEPGASAATSPTEPAPGPGNAAPDAAPDADADAASDSDFDTDRGGDAAPDRSTATPDPATPDPATPGPATPDPEAPIAPGTTPPPAPAPGIESLGGGGNGGEDVVDGPPAEAAHARRTMIGRSAEEVDHAPPRGRYAPVPAPEASASGTPLRWAAPAAALAVASAIVVGRALRKRR
ncbi:SRPBCC family protein [Streptomyces sp. CRN 30]|uniref:SRPBCC family protein n=1 Tax=Streptomyces sp. CRN 30 TaxID=3075613 RepID=UPI002A828A5C|nr:SRPBCC family protein [Streptomyces sp. CRN 30]